MSFWFAKQAKRKRPQGARRAPAGGAGTGAAATKQNAAVLARLGCRACPLNKAEVCAPKMVPTLKAGGQIYFLAQAPGREEDERGRPLIGDAGKLLRECIPDTSICSFDNVINCRPPEDRAPSFNEVECCRPRRIEFIEKAKPRLIVGLGTVAIHAVLGTADLIGLRGRLFAVKIGQHHCWFLPTYHPDYIRQMAYDKGKPLNSRLGHCFRMDIQKAFDLVDALEPPEVLTEADLRSNIHTFDGSGEEHFPVVLDLLEEAIKAPIKAIDLETRFLRPYTDGAAIMSVAFSFADTNFSFALDHPKATWAKDEKARLKQILFRLLKDNTIKVAHNAPFEIEWLAWLLGKEVVNHTAWECTMMQAHFLDERKGKYREDDSKASQYQGLDFLINQYFGLKFKSLFKVNKKDMAKSDLDETLIYNAADTKLTLKLYHRQRKLLKLDHTEEAYIESVFKQPTVALMQHLGVPVDQKAIKAAQNKLAPQIEKLEGDLKQLKVVQAFEKDHGEFNWQSGPSCITIFKDYLKRSEILVLPKGFEIHDFNKASKDKHRNLATPAIKPRYSVDKHTLDQIDHPLSRIIVDLRERAKLKSTYIDAMELGAENAVIYPDRRLHTSFNTTATETGRLSSDGPNLQNYPKRRNSWVRSLVVPPNGYVLVAVDYGQLEACTGAMCSKDKYLTKALWEDYDIHMEWALKFAKAEPELLGGDNTKESMKKFRSLIKNKMVFPAFFGAANESVRGYLHGATGFDVDQGVVDDLMDEFWSTFNGMAHWQKNTMKRYYDKGFVTTMQGRKHRYPLTKNQAVNMPIQGTAAELVCDAMNRLSYIALSTGKMHLHPVMNIHDDLSFFIPDDDKVLEDAIGIIIREMLVFDFKWINTPLSVEVSVGPNWFDVSPIGKFWSHREFGFPRR